MVRTTSIFWVFCTMVALSTRMAGVRADTQSDCEMGAPLAPWTAWGQFPPKVTGQYMAAHGNFLYTFEGDYGIESPVGSLYTQVASDGTGGPWVRTTDRGTYRFGYRIATTDTHIYLVGGQTGSIGGVLRLVEI